MHMCMHAFRSRTWHEVDGHRGADGGEEGVERGDAVREAALLDGARLLEHVHPRFARVLLSVGDGVAHRVAGDDQPYNGCLPLVRLDTAELTGQVLG
eukprot:6174598-Pleurochrysis_carterae.AAC.5